MAATAAVLNTVELLEDIILQLPSPQIPPLQLVSKHWKEVLESSTAIQQHYHNYVLVPIRWEGTFSNLPVYEKSSKIKPHPALRKFSEQKSVSPDTVMTTFDIDRKDLHSEAVMNARAEFTTIPPRKQLLPPQGPPFWARGNP
jgi:hypothetical protein